MAKPRIFVSSTYYDLKHIRSSLEIFIETLGYEAVLSEKGDIAYLPDSALDDSCYREAAASDIFILIVGGRYGAEVSSSSDREDQNFFKRYDSITRREFESAYSRDIPVFILIEKSVHSEYRTYKKNIGKNDINYAHVDSVNVFLLIDKILSMPRNNPVFDFEKASDIEVWLRDQWAGLFREMLRSRSQQKQLLDLTGQVSELKATNETLKNYLEVVLKGITPDSSSIIAEEEKKLNEKVRIDHIRRNPWFRHTISVLDISEDEALNLITKPKSMQEVSEMYSKYIDGSAGRDVYQLLMGFPEAQNDFNLAREMAGVAPIFFKEDEEDRTSRQRSRRQRPIHRD